MSTAIIYNPVSGEQESRAKGIRRSRKRALGEAASSPSSILGLKTRRWRCGCSVAAARIFSSATGQKLCKIPAQQHRPRASPNHREAASPAEPEPSVCSLSLSLSIGVSPYRSFFFFYFFPPSTPKGSTVVETKKHDQPSASVALLSLVSRWCLAAR